MLKIKCCNEKCTAPERIFPWNERPHLRADGRLATEDDEDAISFIERCPYCGTRNKIRVTKVKETEVTRDVI